MTCNCEVCQFSKKINMVREYLKAHQKNELLEVVNEMEDKIVHLEEDMSWWVSNVEDKTWPSYKENMAMMGWIEFPEAGKGEKSK